MRKKKVTASELMAQLNADPEWVAARAREENERQKRAAEWRAAEQPLVKELRAAGFDVESAWDLFNRKEPWNKKERIRPYPEALPILLEHLKRPYPDRVREGIARALAVRDAKFGWVTLTRLYRQEEAGTGTKSGLAVAISAVADDELIDEVIDLAKDARHGSSRLLLLEALERSSDPRAKSALMGLGTDPELSKEVQIIFRRLEKRRRRRTGGEPEQSTRGGLS